MSKRNEAPRSGVLQRYEAVIGLEVHCQLKTVTKLFCGCATLFGVAPNHNVCPVCLGLPGVLPVLNRKAVDYAIRMALAVGAELQEASVFARKQYFYPDLPKNYQITQYDRPYCLGGGLNLSSGKWIRLQRIHLEEDAGKNVHTQEASFVDLNRAGVPLIEIVSEPDIHSPQEAAEYLRKLRAVARYLGISDGNLEEGSFRCDANVSLRRRGDKGLGTRCEIKNLNSFRNIEKAISYEILRQADLLDTGEAVEQMTLLWDPAAGRTRSMRSKGEGEDYRYFPDPDLLPLVISQERIAAIRQTLPELPEEKAARYRNSLGLSEEHATIITADKDLAQYFEAILGHLEGRGSPKLVASWICTEFLREAHEGEWDLASPPLATADFAELIMLLADNVISGNIAKTVLQKMLATGKKPASIVKEEGLVQVVDKEPIIAVIADVLARNEEQVRAYLAGKDKIFGFFVGQIMRASRGKFNPELVNQLLKEQFDARKKQGKP